MNFVKQIPVDPQQHVQGAGRHRMQQFVSFQPEIFSIMAGCMRGRGAPLASLARAAAPALPWRLRRSVPLFCSSSHSGSVEKCWCHTSLQHHRIRSTQEPDMIEHAAAPERQGGHP
jgi:hypothetical protein